VFQIRDAFRLLGDLLAQPVVLLLQSFDLSRLAITIIAACLLPPRAVGSLGDALWWAAVTTTTVGYGDVSPVTGEGRLIAVVLMLVGIAVVGVFTATLASFFFEQDKTTELARLEGRLREIESKLDRLLGQSKASV